MRKKAALIAAIVLILGSLAGGTLAWLTDTTDEVVNTFTVGNIDITLKETTNEYKMVPGLESKKDPKVTVLANSEDCWLYVQVTEAGGDVTVKEDGKYVTKSFADFVEYDMDDGWEELGTDYPGVYYRSVETPAQDSEFRVLKGDKVTYSETITKEMMDALRADGTELPKLTFQAYAVQRATIDSAADAWKKIPTSEE